MSLSKFLQTNILPVIKGKRPEELKAVVIESGRTWFLDNPQECQLIETNLKNLQRDYSQDLIERIKDNILLHYFEKLLPLVCTPDQFAAFINDNVDCSDYISRLESIRESGRGILLATAHFGGVELIGPAIATHKIPVSIVLKFSTEQMSRTSNDLAEKFLQSGSFGPMKFIELGKPKTSAALDMAAVLRRSESLLAVFDEKTDYSIPVTLMNRKFWGGAGLHKLIAYTQRNIALFTAFMIRQNNGRYKLLLNEIDCSSEVVIQKLYDSLEDLLSNNFEQWYFLHEELPLVDQTI